MKLMRKLEVYHREIRMNRWYALFTVFTRVALAAGFLPSGYVKIAGERFTDLSSEHPLGAYLDAFYETGYYYPFVGVMQVLAAILLLIPRTALLGVLIYFPIILNICILSFSVRFDGSLFTSPLMVLACLYLLFWDYHRVKPIWSTQRKQIKKYTPVSWKFPYLFAPLVFITLVAAPFIVYNLYDIMPKNTQAACLSQCPEGAVNCEIFCECIHLEGKPLKDCLGNYEASRQDRS